jgi:TIR domain
MSKKLSQVFLSYATSDRNTAQKIADELRGSGFRVWDPEREILPGADWTAEVKGALDKSEAFVVFISPQAMESHYLSYEIAYVLGEKRFRGRLIPVVIRPTKRAPWILESLQPVRYESPSKTGRQIANLLTQPADVAETKLRAH